MVFDEIGIKKGAIFYKYIKSLIFSSNNIINVFYQWTNIRDLLFWQWVPSWTRLNHKAFWTFKLSYDDLIVTNSLKFNSNPVFCKRIHNPKKFGRKSRAFFYRKGLLHRSVDQSAPVIFKIPKSISISLDQFGNSIKAFGAAIG
jgi:hypothetical protein